MCYFPQIPDTFTTNVGKSAIYVHKSGSNVRKFALDLCKSGSDLHKFNLDLHKFALDLRKIVSDLHKFGLNLHKSGSDLHKSGLNLRKIGSGLHKSGLNLHPSCEYCPPEKGGLYKPCKNRSTKMATRDWWPMSRGEQLAMAKDWVNVLVLNGVLWHMETETIHDFELLEAAAAEALTVAQTEETRTHVSNTRCKEAFATLEAAARDMKRRYFLKPPLKDSDLVSLKLKPHDDVPTPSGNPTAQAKADTYLIGRHELGFRIVYETGSPHDPANKGYRIFYITQSPEEIAPTDPENLHKSFFTKRRKDVLRFDPKESGKMCHIAVQIENEGRKGPWGPIVAALIP